MVATTTLLLSGALALLGAAPAFAQAAPAAVVAPAEAGGLLSFAGTISLFTLTARGDIDGFVLADGTEVKTPPHLSAAVAEAVAVGDAVTIHGFRAAGRPLILAMSLHDDATGRALADLGAASSRAVADPPEPPAATPVRLEGRVRMALHGARGDVNGLLLEDGAVLRLPPAAATRFAALFVPGARIAAEGRRHAVAAGAVVEVTAIGAPAAPLAPVAAGPFGQRAETEPR